MNLIEHELYNYALLLLQKRNGYSMEMRKIASSLAAEAYNKAASKHFGEFSRPNAIVRGGV